MESTTFKYIIRKAGDKWTVVPAGGSKPLPGSALRWEIERPPGYTREDRIEAHIQFCSAVTEHGDEVCFIDSEQITADWSASIPDHLGNDFLAGDLRHSVGKGKKFYYAVWIVDPKGTNDFAIGENPPPKVETGGG